MAALACGALGSGLISGLIDGAGVGLEGGGTIGVVDGSLPMRLPVADLSVELLAVWTAEVEGRGVGTAGAGFAATFRGACTLGVGLAVCAALVVVVVLGAGLGSMRVGRGLVFSGTGVAWLSVFATVGLCCVTGLVSDSGFDIPEGERSST